jgi:hypothetical protein
MYKEEKYNRKLRVKLMIEDITERIQKEKDFGANLEISKHWRTVSN